MIEYTFHAKAIQKWHTLHGTKAPSLILVINLTGLQSNKQELPGDSSNKDKKYRRILLVNL